MKAPPAAKLNIAEAHKRCADAGRQVSKHAIRVWLRKDPLLGKRIGKRWVIDAARLDRFLGITES